jgi:HSP20 family molecular chaperone IbpA
MTNSEKIVYGKEQASENPNNAQRLSQQKLFEPVTDIYESKEGFHIIAEMPGVDEKSVDITLEKNILKLTGKIEKPVLDGFTPVFQEFEIGDYERSFTLSEEIDNDKITALVKDGVVNITLQKAKEVKSKKITIKSA